MILNYLISESTILKEVQCVSTSAEWKERQSYTGKSFAICSVRYTVLCIVEIEENKIGLICDAYGELTTTIIIIIIIIYCNLVVTRWQWLFYMYTKYEIDY